MKGKSSIILDELHSVYFNDVNKFFDGFNLFRKGFPASDELEISSIGRSTLALAHCRPLGRTE